MHFRKAVLAGWRVEAQAERVVVSGRKHTLGQGKDLKRACVMKLDWGIHDGRKTAELDRQQGRPAQDLGEGVKTRGAADLGVGT